jgi:hypothetical protein
VHLSEIWLVPLSAGAAGAVVLSWLAGRLRHDVERLQRSMRPLRTEHRPRRRTD